MPQAVAGQIAAAIFKQIAIAIVTQVLSKTIFKQPKPGPFPINVTVRSTVTERRICLGTIRAGGAMIFVRTSGVNNKYLWYVVVYTGHQCSALKDCWLDSLKIPAADINGTTGAVSTSSFNGKLKIWDHLGTQAQTVDANLTADFPSTWLSTHRLRGMCYRVFRFERSDGAYPNGAPGSCTSLLDGALTYDPRLDSTNGGSGSHRLIDPSTWSFSRNWARNVRWFLSGGSVVNDQSTRLVRYGLQESDSRIDDVYVIAAANISDQSLSGANAPPSGAQVRYTLDVELSCSQMRREICEEILMAGGPGQLVYVHGKWRLYAAAYDAPIHTFTQNDLFGELEVEDTLGEEDRFNSITSVYVDAERDWTEQTSIVRSNAAYVTQDGGQTIPREVILRCVTDQYRVQRVEELILRSARQMRTVKFRFGRQGLKVAPWETFSMSHARYSWSGRVFRCIEREEQRGDDGGLIALITARAEASSVYTDLLTADYTTGTSVTNSIQSEPPDPPTSLTAITAPSYIEFNWQLGEFWKQNGTVELWEYTANTPFASATKIWEGRGTSTRIAKLDYTTRYYWVRVATIGAQFSTTEPSGNGLPGVAAPSNDPVPDPQFVLSTSDPYWWRYNPGGGTVATITLTGGSVGGYASLGAYGGPVVQRGIVSRRPLPYQCARGQIYTITIRARATASSLLTANCIRHNVAYSTSTFTGTSIEALGGLQILGASVGAGFTEFVGLCFICDKSGTAGSAIPNLSAIVSSFDTANYDVDYVAVEAGMNCPPQNSVFTGTTDLSSTITAYLKNMQYSSGSPGTLTLPFAETENIGARIYVEQVSTGLLTIAAQGGETLQASPNLTGNRALAGRYARAYAEVIDSTTWRLVGDI